MLKDSYKIEKIDFFDNSLKQIELIELIRQISTEALIVIKLSVVIFQTTLHRHVTMHSNIFETSL